MSWNPLWGRRRGGRFTDSLTKVLLKSSQLYKFKDIESIWWCLL
jgi:hypothetical protein